MKACVIGAGAWGIALAIVLSDTGFQVEMWDSDPAVTDAINSQHIALKLQGLEIPLSIAARHEAGQALQGASIVVSAVPSVALGTVTRSLGPLIPGDAILVSATKGLDPETGKRPTEAWLSCGPSLGPKLVAMSGPNFAIEIARRLPAATVVASKSEEARETAQAAFMTPYLRVYTHWDVAGVELGGALKNIIAIACGITEGMGIGYNAQAAIISRGIAEVTRLGSALGADPLTFAGLSGVGDLVLTSTGHLSRNRQAGIAIGRGESIESFLARTGYTVEGVATVKSAMELAKDHGISMPITEVVYKILYLGLSTRQGLTEIMGRDRRSEHE
jgi:glycerol-3-phosphate dehydrogenase (NAD(P)+)